MCPKDLIWVVARSHDGLLWPLVLTFLTFCSHDVYDQVVPRRLESASVIGSNLQHKGQSLSPDQCSLYGSSLLDKAELDTLHRLCTYLRHPTEANVLEH